MEAVLGSLVDGVDFELPGNGGLRCRDHVSITHRIIETAAALLVAYVSYVASRKIGRGRGRGLEPHRRLRRLDGGGGGEISMSRWRRILSASLAFVFGLEVGYKLATRQTAFLLNPCHVLTALDIYLLMSPQQMGSERHMNSEKLFTFND